MRISQRGLVWFGVGVIVYVVSLLLDRPILLRWTQIPLGFVIMGLGVAIIVWDAVKARRKESSKESERKKDHGSADD
jgi:hypothetical protein